MLKKIRVEDLKPGMYIADFNTPWLLHPFFPNQITVRSARDIEQMLRCRMTEVYIDTGRGTDSPKAVAAEEVERELGERLQKEVLGVPGAEEAQAPQVPFETEYRWSRELYADAKLAVEHQFREVGGGRRADGESADSVVSDIIASLFRNRDAMLSLARSKSFDQYTFHHSLNVAVLALNLGMQLGILDRELKRLGIGAILHDLGKVRLPGGLLQKLGPLDPQEYDVVKTHSLHGARILLESGSIPAECAAVPLGHHERYDGSGYPRCLTGPGVGKFGLITAIADVYDAMTTARPYQRGTAPTVALRKLYGWAGTHFHPVYVRKFIQSVGIYPIGTTVRLDTGEVGVVVRQNRADLLRPRVRPAVSAGGLPLRRPLDVDLREPDPRGELPHARTVERVIPHGAVGFDVDSLLNGTAAVPSPRGRAVA
jgi:putative nucleotidyltransferase with HDIG domain